MKRGFPTGRVSLRFKGPCDLVVDGGDVIVVTDTDNHRLCKIVDGQVTTLGGSSKSGTVDGAGAVTRFIETYKLVLDERGHLLVTEFPGGGDRKDTLQVVESSLTSSLWMGPVEEVSEDSEEVIPTTTLDNRVGGLWETSGGWGDDRRGAGG